jgi:hypothetical protein
MILPVPGAGQAVASVPIFQHGVLSRAALHSLSGVFVSLGSPKFLLARAAIATGCQHIWFTWNFDATALAIVTLVYVAGIAMGGTDHCH